MHVFFIVYIESIPEHNIGLIMVLVKLGNLVTFFNYLKLSYTLI